MTGGVRVSNLQGSAVIDNPGLFSLYVGGVAATGRAGGRGFMLVAEPGDEAAVLAVRQGVHLSEVHVGAAHLRELAAACLRAAERIEGRA